MTAAEKPKRSRKAATGDYSHMTTSSVGSRLAASDPYCRLAASGTGSRLAASGDHSHLAASGYYSRLAASGDGSHLAVGQNGVAMAAGHASRAKGEAGAVLAIAYRDDHDRPRIAVGYVGEDGIEPDTWYCVDATGRLVKDTDQ